MDRNDKSERNLWAALNIRTTKGTKVHEGVESRTIPLCSLVSFVVNFVVDLFVVFVVSSWFNRHQPRRHNGHNVRTPRLRPGASGKPRRFSRQVLIVAATLALFMLSAPSYAAPDLSSPEAAVEAGREGLDTFWGRDWYDKQADDFKPLNIPPPRKPWGFWKWLEGLFSGWNFDLGGFLKVLMWIALAAVVVAIVYTIVKAAGEIELESAERVDDAEDGRSHIERVEALPVALERPVGDFLAEARRLFAAGELTLAIVYLFSHQLVELDKRRLLRLVKGKTNRQYLRELRRSAPGSPLVARIMEETMLVFERAFFGAHPPDENRMEEAFAAMDEFTSQANAAAEELK